MCAAFLSGLELLLTQRGVGGNGQQTHCPENNGSLLHHPTKDHTLGGLSHKTLSHSSESCQSKVKELVGLGPVAAPLLNPHGSLFRAYSAWVRREEASGVSSSSFLFNLKCVYLSAQVCTHLAFRDTHGAWNSPRG